jgi:hypothetical protein
MTVMIRKYQMKQLLHFFYTVLLLSLVLSGCVRSSNSKAGYRLKKEELIDLIIDHQVAKAATYKYPMELRDSINAVYLEQIFTIHQLDRFDFEHDLQKLEKDPDYYKEIYDEVNLRIRALRDDKRTE